MQLFSAISFATKNKLINYSVIFAETDGDGRVALMEVTSTQQDETRL